MRILEAKILHARRDRDFDQVEALVTLLVKEDGRPVPRHIRIRTAEPLHGRGVLRQRLIASAKALLLAFEATGRQGQRRPPLLPLAA